MISPSRQNNFDLIRLLAAAQVVVAHAIGHTGLEKQLPTWGKQLFDALMLIPGVPIFFVISGFLIAKSFERNPGDLKAYFWRRGLRIFPALWVCLIVTLAVLAGFGFLTFEFMRSKVFLPWLLGQASFAQFYNPEPFRDFGIGVANGALWTITVELQFYIFIPIFHYLTRGKQGRDGLSKCIIAILFFTSFLCYSVMDVKVNGPGGYTAAPLLFKLLFVTLIPHLWMFLLGIFIHWNEERLKSWIEGKFLYYGAGYLVCVGLARWLIELRSVTYYIAELPTRCILAFATIAAAFTCRPLAQRLLGGTDISYGMYIYHSIVINVLVQLGLMTSMLSVAATFVGSIFLSLLSWHLVEKPALACKAVSPRAIWNRITRRQHNEA